MTWVDAFFWTNVSCHALLLASTVWCVAVPARRFYPMSSKGPVYYAMWLMFLYVVATNFALVLLDWNSGPWTSPRRLILGLPVAGLGAGFVTWGIATLGVRGTSALPHRLVASGPYALSRNPQYVGDITLFVGVTIIANSELVLVTHLLTSLVFIVAPLAEEPWLEEQYGEPYRSYKGSAPRFL